MYQVGQTVRAKVGQGTFELLEYQHLFFHCSFSLHFLIHSSLTYSISFPPLPSYSPTLPPLLHPQVVDMDSERHRFIVSLCCSDLRHSNTGDAVANGDWREILVDQLKRYLRQKGEVEPGMTTHPIGAVRRARVCDSCLENHDSCLGVHGSCLGVHGSCLGVCSLCLRG